VPRVISKACLQNHLTAALHFLNIADPNNGKILNYIIHYMNRHSVHSQTQLNTTTVSAALFACDIR